MNKHVRHPGQGQRKDSRPLIPSANSEPIVKGRTVYPSTVKDPDDVGQLLKSGFQNKKIGMTVTKGRWKGFPIYMLTLEERKICLTTCAMWRTCVVLETKVLTSDL